MRLAEVPGRLSALSERSRRGAHAAYHIAREHPGSSIAGAVLAATLVGGLLWYVFGDPKRPVERRRARVRAASERRRRHARAHA